MSLKLYFSCTLTFTSLVDEYHIHASLLSFFSHNDDILGHLRDILRYFLIYDETLDAASFQYEIATKLLLIILDTDRSVSSSIVTSNIEALYITIFLTVLKMPELSLLCQHCLAKWLHQALV